jgi:anthranilate/para-aminobenzoate synthase component I
VSGGRVLIQAGAGIVADSIPEREWRESLRKAEAVRLAFGASPAGP